MSFVLRQRAEQIGTIRWMIASIASSEKCSVSRPLTAPASWPSCWPRFGRACQPGKAARKSGSERSNGVRGQRSRAIEECPGAMRAPRYKIDSRSRKHGGPRGGGERVWTLLKVISCKSRPELLVAAFVDRGGVCCPSTVRGPLSCNVLEFRVRAWGAKCFWEFRPLLGG